LYNTCRIELVQVLSTMYRVEKTGRFKVPEERQ
jgi:Ni,Fe-hydrogenase III small subunit